VHDGYTRVHAKFSTKSVEALVKDGTGKDMGMVVGGVLVNIPSFEIVSAHIGNKPISILIQQFDVVLTIPQPIFGNSTPVDRRAEPVKWLASLMELRHAESSASRVAGQTASQQSQEFATQIRPPPIDPDYEILTGLNLAAPVAPSRKDGAVVFGSKRDSDARSKLDLLNFRARAMGKNSHQPASHVPAQNSLTTSGANESPSPTQSRHLATHTPSTQQNSPSTPPKQLQRHPVTPRSSTAQSTSQSTFHRTALPSSGSSSRPRDADSHHSPASQRSPSTLRLDPNTPRRSLSAVASIKSPNSGHAFSLENDSLIDTAQPEAKQTEADPSTATAESWWTRLPRLTRSITMVPADQRALLDQPSSWDPPPPGKTFPHANIPQSVKDDLRRAEEEEHRAKHLRLTEASHSVHGLQPDSSSPSSYHGKLQHAAVSAGFGTSPNVRKAVFVEKDGDTIMNDSVYTPEIEQAIFPVGEEDDDNDDDALPWESSPPIQQEPISTVHSLPPSSSPPESSPDPPVQFRPRFTALRDLPPDSSGYLEPSQPSPSPSRLLLAPDKELALSHPSADDERSSPTRQPNIDLTVDYVEGTADDLRGVSKTSVLFSTAVQPLNVTQSYTPTKPRPSTADSLTFISSVVRAVATSPQECPPQSTQSSLQKVLDSSPRSGTSPHFAHTSPATSQRVSQNMAGLDTLTAHHSPSKLVPSTFQPFVLPKTLLHGVAMDDPGDSDLPSEVLAANAEHQIRDELEASFLTNNTMDAGGNSHAPHELSAPLRPELNTGFSNTQSPGSKSLGEVFSSPLATSAGLGSGQGLSFLTTNLTLGRPSAQGSSIFNLSQDPPVLEDPSLVNARKRREFFQANIADVEAGESRSTKRVKTTVATSATSRGEPAVEDANKLSIPDGVTPWLNIVRETDLSSFEDASHTNIHNLGMQSRLSGGPPELGGPSIPRLVGTSNLKSPPVKYRQEQHEYMQTVPVLSAEEKRNLMRNRVCIRCREPGHQYFDRDKCSLSTPDTNNDTPIHYEFCRKYPEYTGDKEHFVNLCRALYELAKTPKVLNPDLYDDYIIQNVSGVYKEYVMGCIGKGLPARDWSDYFRRMVDEPSYKQKCMTPDKLDEMSFAQQNLRPQVEDERMQYHEGDSFEKLCKAYRNTMNQDDADAGNDRLNVLSWRL
jgi:hypothetical protein